MQDQRRGSKIICVTDLPALQADLFCRDSPSLVSEHFPRIMNDRIQSGSIIYQPGPMARDLTYTYSKEFCIMGQGPSADGEMAIVA